MMSINGFATKKALKQAVLEGIVSRRRLLETSIMGPEFKGDGTYPIVGPSPYNRKWYAQVTIKDEQIVRVV